MRRALALAAALVALAGPALASPNPVSPQYADSGKPPVTCALTSATTCGTFTPIPGRAFNIEGSGTFVASYQLERLLPGETVWKPITAAGTPLYVWTAAASETAEEDEGGTKYRVNVTSYTSGTLNVRISQ